MFEQKLSGVFEVRIYRPENRIPAILDKASYTDDDYQLNPNLPHADKHDAVNIQRLKRILGAIDYSSVKAKRMLYCRVYHEACLIDKKEGMDFTRMLTLLAHHKLVNDDRALEYAVYHPVLFEIDLTSSHQAEGPASAQGRHGRGDGSCALRQGPVTAAHDRPASQIPPRAGTEASNQCAKYRH